MYHPNVARLLRLSVALAILGALAAAFAAPAAANPIEEDTFRQPFVTLRATVVARAPASHQRPMLRLVDVAQTLAFGNDRQPPNRCASAATLLALDVYVIALAGSRGFDLAEARAIRADIRSALTSLFPTDPVFPTDPIRRCLPPSPILPPNPI